MNVYSILYEYAYINTYLIKSKPFQYRRNLNATNNDDNQRQTPTSAKDYVESLHQNNRVTLLYGKNNVLVIPVFILHH